MKLVLGTVQFGNDYGISNKSGKLETFEVKRIIDYARKRKILTIDTAMSYENANEELSNIDIKGFSIISKLSSYTNVEKNFVKSKIMSDIKKMLKQFKTDKLYGLLVHDVKDLASENGKEIYNTLLELKKKNIVQYIGVSIYSPNEYFDLLKNFDFDIIQAPFNIFDRRIISEGVIESASKLNIKIHVRSIFLQGLLIDRNLPKKFNPWSNKFNSWFEWLDQNNLSPVEACLNFVLHQPSIDSVLLGVQSKSQISEILSFINKTKFDIPNFEINSSDILINPSMWNNL